ncbi:helix-turn-helix domain-containing protein [Streptomyces sp. NPDC058405]|uniref:helix-turn-helix domain-containing protein n=1 Tax=unclassified Streptomyces TaxID=2593676 RepID=UPI0036607B14
MRAARPVGHGLWNYGGFLMDGTYRSLQLPTGTVTLMLVFAGSFRLTDAAERGPTRSYVSYVAGPRSEAMVCEHDGPVYGVRVTLVPWAAYTLLGIPMDGLANTVVDAAELLGTRAGQLARTLESASSWEERFALLDGALWQWMAHGPEHAPTVERAWQRLDHSAGAVAVSGLARDMGWCQRQLERRFREQVGLPLKAVARVMRLQRTLRLLIEGRRASEVAAEAGYHDQAHLSREFKAMTGRTPRLFLAHEAAVLRNSGMGRAEGRITGFPLPCRAS